MSPTLDEARPAVATPCVAGFDPGAATGAVSFYFPDHPELIVSEDMVGAMPRQGVSSTFKFGIAFGIIIGLVTALEVPAHFVAPTKWKRHFGLDADKGKSRALALRLWPARTDLFGLKTNCGRAEAALLARFWAETNGLRFPSFATASQAATRPSEPPHTAAGERECRDATVSEPIPALAKGTANVWPE